MAPVRIGLLGASRIAHQAILGPAGTMDGVRVTRVACSSPARAERYATKLGIDGIEPHYAALVRSDAVDLVYNALPPSGHMEWTLAALAAGKAVLCEKPFAMNAGQARRMVQAASEASLPLIEAFHYRFHPLFNRTLEILHSGSIGELKSLKAWFNVPIPYREGELRYQLALGGGALMDLGCYPVHWLRTVTGVEPTVRTARARQERPGIDLTMEATLDFDGIPANIHCSMAASLPAMDAQLHVQGTRGELTVLNPVSPHGGHTLRWRIGDRLEETTVAGETTYWHQLQHVKAVLAGAARPSADAVGNMAALDAIYTAAGMAPRGRRPDEGSVP